jgi:hypothetical protein
MPISSVPSFIHVKHCGIDLQVSPTHLIDPFETTPFPYGAHERCGGGGGQKFRFAPATAAQQPCPSVGVPAKNKRESLFGIVASSRSTPSALTRFFDFFLCFVTFVFVFCFCVSPDSEAGCKSEVSENRNIVSKTTENPLVRRFLVCCSRHTHVCYFCR